MYSFVSNELTTDRAHRHIHDHSRDLDQNPHHRQSFDSIATIATNSSLPFCICCFSIKSRMKQVSSTAAHSSADPLAMAKCLLLSSFVVRPVASAIFKMIDKDARFNWSARAALPLGKESRIFDVTARNRVDFWYTSNRS